ncbi:MAG: energy transducer TonB [Flavobacteriaceae bacterium]|nr:energy transducer TonB [Flavobacteriaceae bacterium]
MLDTPHKKKAAGLTVVVAILLLLLFFMLGLTYYDPPISYGMEVNFGTLAQGSGEVQPTKSVQTIEQPVKKPVEVEEKVEVTPPKESTEESIKEVLTEKESTVVVPDKKEEVKLREAVEKEPEPEVEPEPVKEVAKVSEATKSVVSNLLKNKTEDGEQTQGEGDDLVQGDKGKLEGNPYSSSYYNNYGLGGRGKGYGLNGRNLQSNGKVVQDCNQEGTVVVRITVNNNGEVVQAVPGVKGSTNTHPCLLEPARKTALLHKWFPDNNAPAEQIGFVVIQFKLGE